MEEYEDLEAEIAMQLEELSSLDVELFTATGSNYEALVSQRRSLIESIDEKHHTMLQLKPIIDQQRVDMADDLLMVNSSFVASSLTQNLQQRVNEVYLSTLGKGKKALNSSQIDILVSIANTCFYEGGDAVMSARLMLNMMHEENEYNDDDLCASNGEMLVNPNPNNQIQGVQLNQLTISPNPAKEKLMISYPAVLEQGFLEIYDLRGVVKYSAFIEEGEPNTFISLEEFTTGIYIVSFKNNGIVETVKFEVLK